MWRLITTPNIKQFKRKWILIKFIITLFLGTVHNTLLVHCLFGWCKRHSEMVGEWLDKECLNLIGWVCYMYVVLPILKDNTKSYQKNTRTSSGSVTVLSKKLHEWNHTNGIQMNSIDHFAVVCSSITWSLKGGKAGSDLVFIRTSLVLSCKSSYYNASKLHLHDIIIHRLTMKNLIGREHSINSQ